MADMTELVGSQQWIDKAAKPVEKAVHGLFESEGGRVAKDTLNGTWLGHPLHPVLTDVPIGAWMMAQVFDGIDAACDSNRYADAARVCILTGLAGAVGAAITGLTDWSDTGGASRRLGFVHGLVNVTATTLFLTSALLRRRERTSGAVAASTAGFATAMVGAYLGGGLVYQQTIGPNHALPNDVPDGFTRTIPASELAEGAMRRVILGDTPVVLIRDQGRICALSERCAHQGGPLSQGELRDGVIHCPWHDSQYRVEDGSLVHGPSTFDQPCFDTRIVDGYIEVKAQ
ncbi:MAG TPA: Rieske 2Fe-2S domain-containing protein [Vicinamibacterales bacterium]|jgi:nitrite reductase/ring-hydroxylating ferredoxin subunit/uncharacterized membrane protein|nr:Rieske 2Fe-2S domain-containing protein [Vicinamibacterales bacterium]